MTEKARTHIYEFGEFSVDANSRLRLLGDGEPEPFTPKVFDTLLCLVERAGKIIDKLKSSKPSQFPKSAKNSSRKSPSNTNATFERKKADLFF